MRMLYDHGNMGSSDGGNFENQITHTNASLREPQHPSRRKVPAGPAGVAPRLGKRGP